MKLIYTLLFFFLTSFENSYSQLPGTYKAKGKDFKYSLTLNSDSSFILTKAFFEGEARCQGKWLQLSKGSILLRCSESTLSEKLQSDYIAQREIPVIILNRKELKIDKVVMLKQ